MLPLIVVVFVFGAVIGSFLNVCIYRIPEGRSVISPRSSCPSCTRTIAWYHNIPVLSYLLLGGRCAYCKIRISLRYPLVEMLTGVLFVLVLLRFGPTTMTPVFWLLAASLVVISLIDLDHQIIPDVVSLPGIVVGFLCSFLVPWVSWSDSLLGILVGGGSLYLVAVAYEWLAKREGMGGGDIKLLAMLGAFMGWKSILPIIFVASLVGSLIGIPLMLLKGADGKLAIPFGPFLALAALIFLLWGPHLIRWYFSFFTQG